MKFLSLAVLALVTVVRAKEANGEGGRRFLKDKRGAVPAYSASAAQNYPVDYAKLAQAQAQAQSLQKGAQYVAQPAVKYYSAQQQQQQQHQHFQYEPQAVAYSAQPAVAKAAPGNANSLAAAYAKLQAAGESQKPQYSLAGDVSSFSYSSPVVKYSNLGVLSQVIGRLSSPSAYTSQGSSAQQPTQYKSAASPVSHLAYAQQLQAAAQQPAAKGLYSLSQPASKPQYQFQQASPVAYQTQQTPTQPKVSYITQPSFSFAAGQSSKYSAAAAGAAAPQYSQAEDGQQYVQASAAPEYSQASSVPQYSQVNAVPQAYAFLPQGYVAAAQQSQYTTEGKSASSATGPQTFTDSRSSNSKSSQESAGSSAQQPSAYQFAFPHLFAVQAQAPQGYTNAQQAYSQAAPAAQHTIPQPVFSQAPQYSQYYSAQAEKYAQPRYVYSNSQ